MTGETDRALQEIAGAVCSVPDTELDAIVDELLDARRPEPDEEVVRPASTAS